MTDTLGMTVESAKVFDYILVPHTHTHMKNFVIADDGDTKAARKEVEARLAAAFPEFDETIIKRMAGSLKRPDLIPNIKEPELDYDGYLCEYALKSFETLLDNPDFQTIAASVPTLIAHPFHACGEPGARAREVYRRVLAQEERLYNALSRAAKMNVGMDINLSTYTDPSDGYMNDPLVAVMRVALRAGCKFGFGTDSHSVAGLEGIRRGDVISEAIGITEEHLVDFVK